MRVKNLLAGLCLSLACAGLAGSGTRRTSTAQSAGSAGVKAYIGANIIDGAGKLAVENAALIVRDGKVEAVGPASKIKIPAGAQTINLAGKFIIPGLISAHAHVSDVQGLRPPAYTAENTLRQLGVFARYGVTTVLSLGGEKEPAFKLRYEQDSTSLDRTRIYLAGNIITGKTPEEARQMIARVAATKPDIIKIRVDDNLGASTKMAPEVYRAIIDEARQRGLRVAAHIFYLEDAKDLLRAGVDFIAHSVRDREIDDEFISLMKKRDIPYCPTLTRELSTFVYESTPSFFADPLFLREADRDVVARLQEPQRQEAMKKSVTAQRYKAALAVAMRNLKKAADAGLLVVMGTDSGAFANRFEGYFEHMEMEMMADAGLTPAQIIRSATSEAARALRVDGIGAITKGAWADFVVLERDPLKDIRNTRGIASVWIAGNLVFIRG
ncbi:MAG TPA: amidohydrolase family protein [Blastocatellia bacterium]|nr:amidohydrolase family protein [Blastocatellia bacterium]